MNKKKEYIPFGEEWKKEMKKLSKDILIHMLKNAYLELQSLKK